MHDAGWKESAAHNKPLAKLGNYLLSFIFFQYYFRYLYFFIFSRGEEVPRLKSTV